ncbi:MAG: glycosyl hydrolase [Methylotetracoccus sp.]
MKASKTHALTACGLCLVWISSAITHAAPTAPTVLSNGVTTVVNTPVPINPTPGVPGSNPANTNYYFYIRPGQGEQQDPNNPNQHKPPVQTFYRAYSSDEQPIQSNDWWTGVGLQYRGWVVGNGNPAVTRSQGFVTEPFLLGFFDAQNPFAGYSEFPQLNGLQLWNQNSMYVNNVGQIVVKDNPTPYSSLYVNANRAALAPWNQPVVTVGLQDVHPILASDGTVPTAKPWTNILIDKYDDWNVQMSYGDKNGAMRIDLANGSPFAWFERTQGGAPFVVWAGAPQGTTGAQLTIWQDGATDPGTTDLGLTVTSAYNPNSPTPATTNAGGQVNTTAAYAIYADGGRWTKTLSADGMLVMYVNSGATRVAVLGLPHDVPFKKAALKAALTTFKPFACRRIVGTQLHYPPIPGSNRNSVPINGKSVPLGYSPQTAKLNYQLSVTNELLSSFPTCTAGPSLQMLFPHQLGRMVPGQQSKMLVNPATGDPYTWNSVKGPLLARTANNLVLSLRTKGILPFLPSVLASSTLQNPLDKSQLAVDDTYQSLRDWFYHNKETNGFIQGSSVVRVLGTYDNTGFNTYQNGFAAFFEGLTIADQLAQSTALKGQIDNSTNNLGACLCKSKQAVATEIRDYLLQTLKELVGQWGDIYTAQLLQIDSKFNTIYGYPTGYGAIQNLNDHHYHYGYFLRAAAAIGRYDCDWLSKYQPLIDQLRQDVGNYDRSSTSYPFLRNFSPFYGHNWADGTCQPGVNGCNQESTSEAINFAAGMIELGQLAGAPACKGAGLDPNLVDVGTYLYEQEINAVEEYWFNQDANLNAPVVTPTPGITEYNGNWPQEFATYLGPDGKTVFHRTIVGQVWSNMLTMANFFGGVPGSYLVHTLPMSASTLYLGRNQPWLSATWQQYLLDLQASGVQTDESGYENLAASVQAMLPNQGTGINGTGLKPALLRIANNTAQGFKFFATDPMAKYWAYTNSLLGQVDDTVLADTTSYGVFKNAAGQRSFVAYNPGGTVLDAVHFFDRKTGAAVSTLTGIPPGTMLANTPTANSVAYDPTTSQPVGRLYLQATSGSLPLTGALTPEPGTWLPAAEQYAFPASNDLSNIAGSLAVIPPSTNNCADIDLPGGPNCPKSNAAYAEWTGHFCGKLIGGSTGTAATRMAIHMNPALNAGWQRDPTIHTNGHVRVEYDFDNDGTTDRIEVVVGGLDLNNTFAIGYQKFTDYYFRCYANFPTSPPNQCSVKTSGFYGDDDTSANPPYIVVLDGRLPGTNQPFPATVGYGTVKVQVYGQAGVNGPTKVALPVSVGTDPLLGRASWIRPPYNGTNCTAP